MILSGILKLTEPHVMMHSAGALISDKAVRPVYWPVNIRNHERMSKMTDTTEKKLAPDVSGLTVLNTGKEIVRLESLWQNRRIVLTFLRHFG